MNRARHPTHRKDTTATIHLPRPNADQVGTFLSIVWVLGNIVAVGLLGVIAVEQPAHAAAPKAPATTADTNQPVE